MKDERLEALKRGIEGLLHDYTSQTGKMVNDITVNITDIRAKNLEKRVVRYVTSK